MQVGKRFYGGDTMSMKSIVRNNRDSLIMWVAYLLIVLVAISALAEKLDGTNWDAGNLYASAVIEHEVNSAGQKTIVRRW
jgi:hypothetical protein